jgi:hypothetical protein
MASQKQIEANRRNALKSAGAKTPEGKAVSRLNSLRHGLRARTVVLPGEDPEEFRRLCDDLEAEWQPRTCTEQFYLEQMAILHWKLTRMEVGEARLYKDQHDAETELPLLDRLWKAQHSQERAYARAQRELERLQKQEAEPSGWVFRLRDTLVSNANLPAEAAPAGGEPTDATPENVTSEANCEAVGQVVSPASPTPAPGSHLPCPPVQTPDHFVVGQGPKPCLY